MSELIVDQENAVRHCVRHFYDVARNDEWLGPTFAASIKNWDTHLLAMDDFWLTALLGQDRYRSAPFPPHLKLKIDQSHFDRWRDLWVASAVETLPEPLRGKAISMGKSMAHCWGQAYQAMTREPAGSP